MTTFDDIVEQLGNVFFVFVIVTIPLYSAVVACIIYYRRHLTSSFFHIFAAVGVADIWVTAHKLIFRTCARLFYPEFAMRHETVLATFSKFGTWYMYFAAVFGVVVISVNRLTALMYPMKYKAWWTPKVVALSIALTWILPLPFGIPMLFPCCYSKWDPKSFMPRFSNPTTKANYWLADVIVEPGIVAPCFVVMYALMFWKARANSRRITKKRSEKEKGDLKTEIKLALMGVLLSGLYIVMVTTYIFWFLGYSWLILDHIFQFTSDLFSASNPYLLLLFSSKLRHYFVRFITFGKVRTMEKGIAATSASMRTG